MRALIYAILALLATVAIARPHIKERQFSGWEQEQGYSQFLEDAQNGDGNQAAQDIANAINELNQLNQ
jgi:hypothetical protein